MKTGKTLTQLAQEIEAQAKAKKDFLVDTRKLKASTEKAATEGPGRNITSIEIPEHGNFPVSEIMHGQVAEALKIPRRYYEGMRENYPELLDYNINFLFNAAPDNRMIRTFDREGGRLGRAMLSNRFARLDNDVALLNALPIFNEYKNDLRVESAEVTEKKLYLKVVFPKIEREVSKGDIVQAGAVISNSEVGMGRISIERLVYRLVCTNGMIIGEGLKRHHVGRHIEIEGSETQLLYSDETLRADDKAFWLKFRDVLLSTLNESHFDNIVARLRDAKEKTIEAINPARSVEVLGQKYALAQGEIEAVAGSFIKNSDFSLYGLANAITFASQAVASYDRATELEKLGGDILNVSSSDWKDISRAALVIG